MCSFCEQPCKKCGKDKLSKCTECIAELPLLFNGTCVDHCPDLYEPNNATINQCILVGLRCIEGFHVNDQGTGCVPNSFECELGFQINDRNTACIPAPGSAVPFPFLFTAICMSMVVAYSKLKEFSHTKVCTSLVFLLGSMELLQYITMAIDAIRLEQYLAAFLCFLAFFLLIFCNVAFWLAYNGSVMRDQSFKNWIRIFPKTQLLLPVACLFINYKFVRLVFSGFFGMENTQAVFKNPSYTIHRPLRMATLF